MVEKYSIVAKVPQSVKQQINLLFSRYGKNHHDGLTWYTGDRLIVPIRDFGKHIHDLDKAIVALHSLSSISSETATLRDKVRVLDDHLVYIPVDGLDGMATEVRQMTKHIGEDETHSFVGRITVVKRNHRSHHRLPSIEETFHGEFVVDKLYLIHTVHDEHGRVTCKSLGSVGLGQHH
jgi:2'-5' RNA ligase